MEHNHSTLGCLLRSSGKENHPLLIFFHIPITSGPESNQIGPINIYSDGSFLGLPSSQFRPRHRPLSRERRFDANKSRSPEPRQNAKERQTQPQFFPPWLPSQTSRENPKIPPEASSSPATRSILLRRRWPDHLWPVPFRSVRVPSSSPACGVLDRCFPSLRSSSWPFLLFFSPVVSLPFVVVALLAIVFLPGGRGIRVELVFVVFFPRKLFG